MFPGETEARKQIVYFSKKVHAGGFVSATDGNLSIRLDRQHVIITPSGLRKEDMHIDAPIVIDMHGEPVSDSRRPSTEHKVHLEAYRRRPDVQAVIHAHPPKAIAFTIANAPLDTCVLPEVVVTLGDVPVAPYAAPSTDALPQSMSELIKNSDALMLARHGSVTVGPSLSDAFKKLEKLEHNAEILIWARILGGHTPFSGPQLSELQGLRDFYGITTKQVACAPSGLRAGAARGAQDRPPGGGWAIPWQPGSSGTPAGSGPPSDGKPDLAAATSDPQLAALVRSITERVRKE